MSTMTAHRTHQPAWGRAICLVAAVGVLIWGTLSGTPNQLRGLATITDGDTIKVAGVSVRLDGVDAEELHEPNGDNARAVLADIIGGASVRCVLIGEKTHGREIGVCFTAAEVEINAEIIRRGAALDCAHYSAGRYRLLEPPGARRRLKRKPYCDWAVRL